MQKSDVIFINPRGHIRELDDAGDIGFYSDSEQKLKKNNFSTMPRIDNDIKLDFKDVLVRPKRSTLKSRSEVSYHLPCQ